MDFFWKQKKAVRSTYHRIKVSSYLSKGIGVNVTKTARSKLQKLSTDRKTSGD